MTERTGKRGRRAWKVRRTACDHAGWPVGNACGAARYTRRLTIRRGAAVQLADRRAQF
jgi:hypothetical protein